jgi:serine/threonine protein kinase
VLWLVGVSTVQEPWYIVTELCFYGDLKSILVRHKKYQILFQKDELLRFATQIASGMSYLASLKVWSAVLFSFP